MSFDQLQLDPYFLAKIYTQPVIPGKSTPVAVAQKPLPKVKYLGENQKNIALFIQNESEAYLNDELFNLLTNILNACKLGMQDVALVNIATMPPSPLTAWQQAVPMKQCVLFGIASARVGLEPLPNYQLHNADGIQVMFSDPLQDIAADKQLKGKLWNGLKQLFL
ncbi:hypothetical protein F0L74_16780 [Chitinophaga agrisoli]|uniref:DNA polymerase III psi subunit n=1 Tax=Chitinophaga agrisoli TaxID=2607653 RepID=A0A5B2VSD4_9BACT|nr:hypothetical protein [Chitinophaga agrisoli]KAA2241548.1 hypothetical protein F0L74_16780 [Chitinophaga agrisoli]